MADPYLTADEVRPRISVGGQALSASKFPDAWVERQVLLFEVKLEEHTGDAYVEREADVAVTVGGGASSLVLPNVNIVSVDSVQIDGEAVTPSEHQPRLAAGIVALDQTVQPTQHVQVAYTYGNTDTRVQEIAKEACVRYIERIASLERSSNTQDASRVFNQDGGSTVFIQPDPENGRLTGFSEVDGLVRTLRRYVIPGIA